MWGGVKVDVWGAIQRKPALEITTTRPKKELNAVVGVWQGCGVVCVCVCAGGSRILTYRMSASEHIVPAYESESGPCVTALISMHSSKACWHGIMMRGAVCV